MPKTLLVADDSVTIQKIVGIAFAQEDFAITYVNNGEDAIAKARQLKPNAILADVVMPKKNGYEVCDAVKKDPQLRSIPVLLLAGTHEPFDEAKGKSVGADGYIIKPFEAQALVDRVTELMSKPASAAVAPQPVAAATPPPPAAPARTPTPPAAPAKPAVPTPPPQAARPVPTPPPIPKAPPPPAPSPAMTIAGQMPISRDAPLLDLEPPAPEPVFDLSFDDIAAPEASTPVVPVENVVAASAEESLATDETSTTLPAGDFWDLAAETPAAPSAPALEIADAPPPAAEPQQNAWGTIAAGSWDDFQPAAAEPAPVDILENTAPIREEPAASFASGDDFGLDLTADTATMEIQDVASAAQEIPHTTPAASEGASFDPNAAVSAGINLTEAQIEAIVSKVFAKVIERIAWEVVPDMAETMIKEELKRLTQETT